MTPQQNRIMHAILAQLNMTPQKESLAQSFSEGRTHKTSELSDAEAKQLINWLKTQQPPIKHEGLNAKADKMRKRMISMAWQMNWIKPNAANTGMVANMDSLNTWCVKFGYLHKPLNEYDYAELPRLLTQFEAVLRTFVVAVSKNN